MKTSTIKTLVKIVAILLVAICLLSVSNNVFADQISPKDITANEDIDDGGALQLAKKAATWIRNISVIAAVIIIMIIGVKYILGSVEEKAEYKKTFMPLIIGIILVVAATTIATFIFNAAAIDEKAASNKYIVATNVLNETTNA